MVVYSYFLSDDSDIIVTLVKVISVCAANDYRCKWKFCYTICVSPKCC